MCRASSKKRHNVGIPVIMFGNDDNVSFFPLFLLLSEVGRQSRGK
jgi:hypothetical protein